MIEIRIKLNPSQVSALLRILSNVVILVSLLVGLPGH
jgi:hypothetical protein